MQLGKVLRAWKARIQESESLAVLRYQIATARAHNSRSGQSQMRVLTDTMSVVIAGVLLVGVTFVVSQQLLASGSSGDFNLTGLARLLTTLSPIIVGIAYIIIAFGGLGRASGGA